MTNKTQTRKHRSPAELIAEAEARIEKLRVKEAMDKAKSSPEVSSVLSAIEDLTKSQREASKLLGNSPQSCSARRMKHQLWLDEINASEALATVSSDANKVARTALQSLLNTATTALANDEEVDPEGIAVQVASIVGTYNSDPEVAKATEALASAMSAREAFKTAPSENENSKTQEAS